MPTVWRQIYEDGEVGSGVANNRVFKAFNNGRRQISACSLIGHGAVHKAIANHPVVFSKGGPYDGFQMIITGDGKQQGFGKGAKFCQLAVQQKLANGFGLGDPPGSLVIMTFLPSRCRLLANRRTWVDFPAPSPPSNVMNLPMLPHFRLVTIILVTQPACAIWPMH